MQKKWPGGHLLGDVSGVMPGVTRNPAPTESTRGPTRPLRSAGLSPATSPSVPLRKGGSPPAPGEGPTVGAGPRACPGKPARAGGGAPPGSPQLDERQLQPDHVGMPGDPPLLVHLMQVGMSTSAATRCAPKSGCRPTTGLTCTTNGINTDARRSVIDPLTAATLEVGSASANSRASRAWSAGSRARSSPSRSDNPSPRRKMARGLDACFRRNDGRLHSSIKRSTARWNETLVSRS